MMTDCEVESVGWPHNLVAIRSVVIGIIVHDVLPGGFGWPGNVHNLGANILFVQVLPVCTSDTGIIYVLPINLLGINSAIKS